MARPSFDAPATDLRRGGIVTLSASLAGGSLLGMQAAAGVTAELDARDGHRTDWTGLPLVSGARIYDFRPGRTPAYLDKELGRAAVRAARLGWFPLGTRGAGRSAGMGQGAAEQASAT